jgi:hypothetical protein
MEPMSLLVLLAFAAIISIIYQKLNPWIASTSWGAKALGNGSFFRATAVMTFVIFVAIIGASILLGAVDSRPQLPKA